MWMGWKLCGEGRTIRDGSKPMMAGSTTGSAMRRDFASPQTIKATIGSKIRMAASMSTTLTEAPISMTAKREKSSTMIISFGTSSTLSLGSSTRGSLLQKTSSPKNKEKFEEETT
eukprot:CAMPEP_0202963720 /NCGR_PEP_ID=MMETSP1396-20130829/7727_1 /ASSEMBLY_ACC=CAM_ASM_000872 /TAXON_ID= /ORGANISM="Pseudokeronopsis sp., Strain Brazil" /LENGTH=114 /DNA_ID=CAMNT_0049685161 /DNA_START=568 /DNA_END=908 /DNA_ORIENTATION=+